MQVQNWQIYPTVLFSVHIFILPKRDFVIFLTSKFAKLHWLGCFCIQGGTLNHPGINNKDIFHCTEVGRDPDITQPGAVSLFCCLSVLLFVVHLLPRVSSGQLTLWLEVGCQ